MAHSSNFYRLQSLSHRLSKDTTSTSESFKGKEISLSHTAPASSRTSPDRRTTHLSIGSNDAPRRLNLSKVSKDQLRDLLEYVNDGAVSEEGLVPMNTFDMNVHYLHSSDVTSRVRTLFSNSDEIGFFICENMLTHRIGEDLEITYRLKPCGFFPATCFMLYGSDKLIGVRRLCVDVRFLGGRERYFHVARSESIDGMSDLTCDAFLEVLGQYEDFITYFSFSKKKVMSSASLSQTDSLDSVLSMFLVRSLIYIFYYLTDLSQEDVESMSTMSVATFSQLPHVTIHKHIARISPNTTINFESLRVIFRLPDDFHGILFRSFFPSYPKMAAVEKLITVSHLRPEQLVISRMDGKIPLELDDGYSQSPVFSAFHGVLVVQLQPDALSTQLIVNKYIPSTLPKTTLSSSLLFGVTRDFDCPLIILESMTGEKFEIFHKQLLWDGKSDMFTVLSSTTTSLFSAAQGYFPKKFWRTTSSSLAEDFNLLFHLPDQLSYNETGNSRAEVLINGMGYIANRTLRLYEYNNSNLPMVTFNVNSTLVPSQTPILVYEYYKFVFNKSEVLVDPGASISMAELLHDFARQSEYRCSVDVRFFLEDGSPVYPRTCSLSFPAGMSWSFMRLPQGFSSQTLYSRLSIHDWYDVVIRLFEKTGNLSLEIELLHRSVDRLEKAVRALNEGLVELGKQVTKISQYLEESTHLPWWKTALSVLSQILSVAGSILMPFFLPVGIACMIGASAISIGLAFAGGDYTAGAVQLVGLILSLGVGGYKIIKNPNTSFTPGKLVADGVIPKEIPKGVSRELFRSDGVWIENKPLSMFGPKVEQVGAGLIARRGALNRFLVSMNLAPVHSRVRAQTTRVVDGDVYRTTLITGVTDGLPYVSHQNPRPGTLELIEKFDVSKQAFVPGWNVGNVPKTNVFDEIPRSIRGMLLEGNGGGPSYSALKTTWRSATLDERALFLNEAQLDYQRNIRGQYTEMKKSRIPIAFDESLTRNVFNVYSKHTGLYELLPFGKTSGANNCQTYAREVHGFMAKGRISTRKINNTSFINDLLIGINDSAEFKAVYGSSLHRG